MTGPTGFQKIHLCLVRETPQNKSNSAVPFNPGTDKQWPLTAVVFNGFFRSIDSTALLLVAVLIHCAPVVELVTPMSQLTDVLGVRILVKYLP